ncbi:MAG: acetyl-CoA carboxylase biotin carboxyl carrier protein subunit, partial [Ilumatobacteraceae bacterium]
MADTRIDAPMQGTIVTVDVSTGESVVTGQQLMLIESMKMHHAIESPCDGTVADVLVVVGSTVPAGSPLLVVTPGVVVREAAARSATADPAAIRPDLAEVHARHAIGLDAARPQAVQRRR